MIIISYELSGRLGNNIIQYWTAYFLSKQTGGLLVPPPNKGATPLIIDDNDWETWAPTMTDEQIRDKFALTQKANIYLKGYFQRGNVFLRHPEWLLETIQSTFQFVPQLPIKQLFQPCSIAMSPSTAVVHLRLSDFNYQGQSNIVDPMFYVTEMKLAIDQHNIDSFLVVVDKITLQGESKYMNKLSQLLTANIDEIASGRVKLQLLSGSVLEDWNTIRCAPYVISSNSTYAFTACLYGMLDTTDVEGGVKRVVYPQTYFYPQQQFDILLDGWRNVDVQRINFDTL